MINKLHKAEARAKVSDDKLKEFYKNIRNSGQLIDKAVSASGNHRVSS